MSTPHPAATHPTREQWLEAAVEEYRGLFAQVGYPLPDHVAVSCGWGYGKAQAESKDLPGQCWSGMHTDNGHAQIFISPMVADPVTVLGTLLHMLVHAALDPDMRHNGEFRKAARALGLEGPMRATTPSLELGLDLHNVTQPGAALGPYPHSPIELLPDLAVNDPQARPLVSVGGTSVGRGTTAPAPQVSRWVSVHCPNCPGATGRGARTVKLSRTALEAGAPLCGRVLDDATGYRCTEEMREG